MPHAPKPLSLELSRLLAARGSIRRLEKGDRLVVEGDVSHSLFVLLTGQLKVFTRDERGREVIYNLLHPGEILGEMFLDGGPRSASVSALMDCECVEIREREVRALIREHPDFAETLVIRLIERLRNATLQIRSLALHDVYARTVDQISQLARTEHDVRILPTTVTQLQIASRIGATREMVNHVFRDLLRAGLLVRDGKGGLIVTKELPKQRSPAPGCR